MRVDARSLLLTAARDHARFAAELTDVGCLPVSEPLRTQWHIGRGRIAAAALADALDLLRIAETKR